MADKDIFARAKEVRVDLDQEDAEIKRRQARRRKLKVELTGLRKQIAAAIGGKPRGPRKPKAPATLEPALPAQCEHGTKLPGYCQACLDETQVPLEGEQADHD